jgi:hypothetical protein
METTCGVMFVALTVLVGGSTSRAEYRFSDGRRSQFTQVFCPRGARAYGPRESDFSHTRLAMGIPFFSKMKYSLLRWTRLTNPPRLVRALVGGIVVMMGEDV